MNKELNRYIELTTWIRELSSPQIASSTTPEEYRDNLIRSFTRIGEISKFNQAILDEHFYPLLEPGRDLNDDDIEVLREFSSSLLDATNMENIDLPMLFIQAEKMLADAEKKGDDRLIILALDNIVMANYALLTATLRLYPCYDICFKYRDNGIAAAKRMIEYLDKDKFVTLDDYCKETVLINSRYISALFELADSDDPVKQDQEDMQTIETSLSLASDPFYLENTPNFDWNYHTFRCLQYLTCCTEYSNKETFSPKVAEKSLAYTYKFIDFLKNNIPEKQKECNENTQELYVLRNCYFANKINKEEYKKGLRNIINTNDLSNPSLDTMYVSFTAPYEYMMTIDKDNLEEIDKEVLRKFYYEMISYVYYLPKSGGLSFMLTFLTYIMKNYIEVEGGPNLEEMCLSLTAALHPPTFVHTMSVADFSAMLTKHLIEKNPAIFTSLPEYNSIEEVKAHSKEIIDFIRHSAFIHDVGKIFIIETIITYGRKLLSSEFDIIKAHPEIGYYLLNISPSTAKYADIARGHHKWFNNQGGYPDTFDMDATPYKTIISILTVADCLDASTDSVGRNYKKGKDLNEYIEEIEKESGTRYAPYVVEILRDPEVYNDLIYLLDTVRDENYRKTYELLKEL